PVGYDLFHFVLQSGVLVRRQSWPQIERQLLEAWEQLGLYLPHGPYLSLYLADHISRYLTHYVEQGILHPQSWWLIETWEAAL
ncbi:MAG: hypothetical protein D6722_10900, partial [Bacteroidetes bacterium]